MNFEQYQQEEDNYRFLRTTCGLIGFIVFFLAAFCSFIVAGETEDYYEFNIILGAILLCVTTAFFCCVMHESKRVFLLTNPSEGVEMVPLMPQQQPEPQDEPHQEPLRGDEDGQERDVHRWPTGDSIETSDMENDSDPDIQELERLGKPRSTTECNESIDETGENDQDKRPTNSGGKSIGIEFDSSKAGPSKVD